MSSGDFEELSRRQGERLYGRLVRLTVGAPGSEGRRWHTLRIAGNIVKTSRRKPNKCKFQIWNLSDDSIGFIQGAGNTIQIEAGYVGSTELLFVGDIDDAEVKYDNDGLDRVLEIEAADSRVVYQRAKVFETYESPLDGLTLIRRLAASAAINIASIPDDVEPLDYPFGYTAAGPLKDLLTDVCDDHGLEWSFQNGELVFARAGESTPDEAFVVSAATGNLIGSPEKGKRGKVTFRALLSGRIRPKRLVRLESRDVTGWFVPSKVTYAFDNGFDDTFYADVEAKERKGRR